MKQTGVALFALLFLLVFSCPVPAQVLDLADIVGGGDGTGVGTNSGISVVTGDATVRHASLLTAPVNVYTTSNNPLIDGVFIPDGGPGGSAVITVSSTGTTVTGVADTTGFGTASQNTWDHIWNGLNTGTSTSLAGSVLGVHANKGITFDLDAIEAANSGLQVTSTNLTAAMGTFSPLAGSVDFYAFVDGVPIATTSIATRDSTVAFGSIPIAPDASYLTLITSSNGTIRSRLVHVA